MMKKLYIKPIILVVATVPAQLCAASPNTWHVDHKEHTGDESSDPDYGEVIYDDGSISGYNPFDESNW